MENTENKIPNSENQDTQNSSFFSESISSSNGLEPFPKLRFLEFKNTYKKIKLNKAVERIQRKDPTSEAPVMMLSAASGFIMQSEKYSRENAGQSLKKYILLKKGELAYNHGASKYKPFGCCFELKEEEARIPYVYHCFAVKENNDKSYIARLLNNQKIDQQLKRLISSSVRMDGLLNISYEEYTGIDLYLPSLPEQQKIAAFLSLVDVRIEKQRKLVENLKKYKRGLLSAIFDRKLRFKDTDFSLWKNVRLSECCLGFDNKRQPISSELREKGTVPYYGANGIQDYVKDYIFDGEYILLAEDGGHFDEFQTKPIAQYITGKSWVNNHAHILQATEKDCTKYIYYALVHKDIRKYINGSSRAKLNQEDMWQIVILLPNLKQQIKIAQFMSSIDKILSIEEKMLTVLEEKKQGLLQQMFI
mgnify:CR=1 FL=1